MVVLEDICNHLSLPPQQGLRVKQGGVNGSEIKGKSMSSQMLIKGN